MAPASIIFCYILLNSASLQHLLLLKHFPQPIHGVKETSLRSIISQTKFFPFKVSTILLQRICEVLFSLLCRILDAEIHKTFICTSSAVLFVNGFQFIPFPHLMPKFVYPILIFPSAISEITSTRNSCSRSNTRAASVSGVSLSITGTVV